MKLIKLIISLPVMLLLVMCYGIFAIGSLGAAMILALTNKLLN